MAIDILSTTRAKTADTPNARGAPPIPIFDAGKMFSSMLEQTFAGRDAARQQAAARGQNATREDRQAAPATRPEEAAPRPATARTTAKERPAAPKRRDDDSDDEIAVEARPRPKDKDAEDKPVDGEAAVAAKPDSEPADDGDKPAEDPSDQAADQAAAQAAVALVVPAITPPKAAAKPDEDAAAADAAPLVARATQTAATAAGQAAPEDKPADALAATLQAMTPQQMTEVANAAAPVAKAAKSAAEGLRDQLSRAEAALADLLADIGGGSIVSASSAASTGAGGQPGGGLLDGAAWSLMQQSPGVAAGTAPQALTFAGLLQAGLAAVAEAGGEETAGTTTAAIETTTATTTAVPVLAGAMQGADGPDMPQATVNAQAARPALPLPVADQIAVHLGRAIKDEVKAINVQLNPEELGRVDIRLEFGQDGRVSAHVTADNQQALDLLQRDQRALERSLTDAGLKTDNSSLSFSLRNDGAGNDGFNRFAQNQGGGQQGSQRQNRGGRGAAAADVTGIDAGATARPRTIAADGALDIKV